MRPSSSREPMMPESDLPPRMMAVGESLLEVYISAKELTMMRLSSLMVPCLSEICEPSFCISYDLAAILSWVRDMSASSFLRFNSRPLMVPARVEACEPRESICF